MAPFNADVVVQGFKERVESITHYADRLYVGTSTGSLHIYSVDKDSGGSSVRAVLEESRKTFTRRSIEQLGFIKDVNSLVALSEATVTLFSLPGLSPATPLTQAKGAMSFAVDSSVQYFPDPSGTSGTKSIPSVVTYLAVGCKKKIVLYSWRDGELQDTKELALPHSPRTMTFPTSRVIIMSYTVSEYAILAIDSMSVSEPPAPAPSVNVPTTVGGMASLGKGALSGLGGYMTLGLGAKAKPSVIKITEGEFALTKETSSIFLTPEGKVSRPSFEWPAPPEETAFVKPYLFSSLPAGTNLNPLTSSQANASPTPLIQIVSSLSLSAVQTIAYPFSSTAVSAKPSESSSRSLRVLTSAPGFKSPLYVVATPTDRGALAVEGSSIWRFSMQPWGKQVDELVSIGLYADALTLLGSLDAGSLDDTERRVAHIRGLHAVSLFQDEKYDDAMKTFTELEINPAKVIALYPESISGRLATSPDRWIELFGGSPPPSPLAEITSETESSSSPATGSTPTSAVVRPPSPKGSIAGTLRATLVDLVPGLPSQDQDHEKPGASNTGTGAREKVKDAYTRSTDSLLVFLGDKRPKLFAALATIGITPAKSHDVPALSELSIADLFELPNGSPSSLTPEQLLRFAQIVDTALFKLYLVIRPGLLGSLCRLDNWCEVEEVEEVLKQREKYEELKDLYKGKKMHEKALALLKERSLHEEDVFEKIDPTIRYLQKLGPEYLGLIFAWCKWVLDADASRGLQIFTADEVDLPRVDVTNFLAARDLGLTARYIEFLIDEMHETTPLFHDRLAEIYLIQTKDALRRGDTESKKITYEKLLNFINTSVEYDPVRLFSRLPSDDLYEARAVLLGHLGKHEGALDIYVNRLKDYAAAEEYCKKVYQKDPDPKGAFLMLLRIYLRPAGQPRSPTTAQAPESLLGPALDLISRHSPRLDSVEVLQLLPPMVKASEIRAFLTEALRTTRVDDRITRELWKAREDQVDRKLMAMQSRRVRITDSRICPQCHKRIAGSVIAVHAPRGEVTHYQCRELFSKKLAESVR